MYIRYGHKQRKKERTANIENADANGEREGEKRERERKIKR